MAEIKLSMVQSALLEMTQRDSDRLVAEANRLRASAEANMQKAVGIIMQEHGHEFGPDKKVTIQKDGVSFIGLSWPDATAATDDTTAQPQAPAAKDD